MASLVCMSVSRTIVHIRADANGNSNKKNTRRNEIENTRKPLLKRIQSDLRRIRDEEKSYSSDLIKEIIPVKISFNKELIDKLKNILPIKVEITKKDSSKTITPEVVSDAELDV